jgi:hypothetical protein
VKRRQHDDHVELFVRQLRPRLVQELDTAAARPGSADELGALIDADDAAGPAAFRLDAEEPLIASEVEETLALEVRRQPDRLELRRRVRSRGLIKGLVCGPCDLDPSARRSTPEL